MRRVFSLGFLLAIIPSQANAAKILTLEDYLSQVKMANQSLQSAVAIIEATRLREASSDLITTPQVFGQFARKLDEKPPDSALAGKKTEATSYSLGVQKTWNFGLQTQVSYNLTDIDVSRDTIPPLLAPGVPNPLAVLNQGAHQAQARTQLDLVQPLWKNWVGHEYDLARESAQAKLAMQRQGEQYKVKTMLAQAEFIYWQLALANEAVRNQEAALIRFQKIRNWVQHRVNLSLADRSDLLQAEAGLKARNFELQLAERDRSALQRNFNTLRGMQGDRLEESVVPISSRILSEMNVNAGAVKRLDVDLARSAQRIAEADLEQLREKFKASIDLFGSYALNAQDDKLATAAGDALQTNKPTILLGIRFSTPLDHQLIDRERDGLVKLSESARLEKEQKEFNVKQEWDELLRQLSDAKARLRLATEIENAQKQKLDYERVRLERGRTTSYQILLFEQDYATAQLGAIKVKADILGVMAKLKSFGDAL
ncbi:MAG: TolC family protein [Proteobacteria bacterium]|nr:TolC family protein [Pseudomonadota bacterium]